MITKQIICFVVVLYSIATISAVKKQYSFKRNFTKPVTSYNLSSRYDETSKLKKKNFTSRICFLKEKVEIPDLEMLKRNLSGQVLKVTALEEYPFTYFEHKNGKILGRGATFKLLDILARKYNFTYEIITPKNNYFGTIRGRNASVLELLTTGKAEMGIGYIPLMKDYYTRVLYSSQINLAKYHILMVKPRGSIINRGLLAPFSGAVWIATAIFFFVMTPVIYLAIKFHRNFGKGEKIETLTQIIWFIYGALVRQGHSVNVTPINDSTRILFATWWIFVTILTTFYTANLVAFLARSEFPFSISSIEDFVKTNTKLLVKKGGPVEYALVKDQTLALLKERIDVNAPHFGGSPNDSQHMMETLLKHNYAIIASYTGAKHLMYDYYMSRRVSAKEFVSREHCPFILSKKPIFWGIQSFVYDCRSQLSFLFDNDLRLLVEAGITEYLKQSNLPNEHVCDLAKQKVETQLKVQDLDKTFALVFIGFLVSFVALLAEIYYVKRQQTKRSTSERCSRPSSRISVINEILQDFLQPKRDIEF